MTWLRIRLTEEQQRVANEERSAHPNPRIREKMLVIWLLPIKPPAPLPRYIHNVPSDLRPMRSDLPSPLKSPGENSIVSVFQSTGEVTCTPGAR